MNFEKEIFINVLSSFLNNEKPKVNQQIDWKYIYRLAEIHSVCGIIANQIKFIDKKYQPEALIKSKFNQQLGLTIINYDKRNDAVNFIRNLFNRNRIDFLFVKGVVLQKYYPVCELRQSGDIDVIIRKSDFQPVAELLNKNGIKILGCTSEVINADVDGMVVEIHCTSDVIGSYFDDIFSHCDKLSECEYQLQPYDHLLYVICHLCKHLAYRGAGLRMLADIDVIVRSIDKFDINLIYSMAESAGVLQSTKVLLSLCKKWFKTPLDIPELTDLHLLDCFESVIIDGGNFGYEINSIPLVNYKKSKIATFFSLAFPSRKFLKIAYPYYAAHSFLLPIARINRLIDGVFRKRKQAKSALRQLTGNSDIMSVQKQLVNELGLGD